MSSLPKLLLPRRRKASGSDNLNNVSCVEVGGAGGLVGFTDSKRPADPELIISVRIAEILFLAIKGDGQ